MSGRDYQRGRVYAWERHMVAPRDPGRIPFAAAQGMVDAIWAEQGLSYPPLVEKLPPQATTLLGEACRLSIRLGESTPSWCLLHEIAHAMSMTHTGQGAGHGPVFMGLYVALLERYLRLDSRLLLESLEASGIDVLPDAVPVFLD
jgi:hypothetical protein